MPRGRRRAVHPDLLRAGDAPCDSVIADELTAITIIANYYSAGLRPGFLARFEPIDDWTKVGVLTASVLGAAILISRNRKYAKQPNDSVPGPTATTAAPTADPRRLTAAPPRH